MLPGEEDVSLESGFHSGHDWRTFLTAFFLSSAWGATSTGAATGRLLTASPRSAPEATAGLPDAMMGRNGIIRRRDGMASVPCRCVAESVRLLEGAVDEAVEGLLDRVRGVADATWSLQLFLYLE